jgi:phospholipid/cholesterol/gamma-HCH transport system permease protein
VNERALASAFMLGQRSLARIGRAVRVRSSFLLKLAALSWGVIYELIRIRSWRRTSRAEFWRILRQATVGCLATTLVTASLTGLALVAQAVSWLELAGGEELEGSLLVSVLVRELTPLLIGMVVLGRCGTVAVVELSSLRTGHSVGALASQGLDPVLLFIVPRTMAFAWASFTLGVFFVLTALAVGFVAGSLLGQVRESVWMFADHVLNSTQTSVFVIFPVKMLAIGALVGLTTCLTGLTARPGDGAPALLPRGFTRGALAILFTSLVLSLAA